jgi:hypothetical protein
MRRTAFLALLLATAFWLFSTWFLFGCTPRIYDPLTRTYQPDLGEVLEQLDRERSRVSPPRTPRENVSCAILEP